MAQKRNKPFFYFYSVNNSNLLMPLISFPCFPIISHFSHCQGMNASITSKPGSVFVDQNCLYNIVSCRWQSSLSERSKQKFGACTTKTKGAPTVKVVTTESWNGMG